MRLPPPNLVGFARSWLCKNRNITSVGSTATKCGFHNQECATYIHQPDSCLHMLWSFSCRWFTYFMDTPVMNAFAQLQLLYDRVRTSSFKTSQWGSYVINASPGRVFWESQVAPMSSSANVSQSPSLAYSQGVRSYDNKSTYPRLSQHASLLETDEMEFWMLFNVDEKNTRYGQFLALFFWPFKILASIHSLKRAWLLPRPGKTSEQDWWCLPVRPLHLHIYHFLPLAQTILLTICHSQSASKIQPA